MFNEVGDNLQEVDLKVFYRHKVHRLDLLLTVVRCQD